MIPRNTQSRPVQFLSSDRAKLASLGTAATRDFGTKTGQIPVVPMPMSSMPNAKLRLDIHSFEVNLCATAQRSGAFNLTGLAILSPTSSVRVWQSAKPATGKGTLSDEYEMDQISIVGNIVNVFTIRCYWVATGPVMGNFKFFYQLRS